MSGFLFLKKIISVKAGQKSPTNNSQNKWACSYELFVPDNVDIKNMSSKIF